MKMGQQKSFFVFFSILFEKVHLIETSFMQYLQSVNNVGPKR